ncbi:hypothetical protein OAP60_00070 [bacterium]|nr:hypothetical protein [bacterium]
MKKWVIIGILLCSALWAKDRWYSKNLKGIEELNLEFNLMGVEDAVWENRVVSFIELRFLEYDLRMVKNKMPKIAFDIHVLDSRVEAVSSFLVVLSVYNYSISEPNYYKSIADTLITKKLMTSKVFSHEIMGQSSSENLYKDVEKSVNQLISFFIDQWFRDNPMKQF